MKFDQLAIELEVCQFCDAIDYCITALTVKHETVKICQTCLSKLNLDEIMFSPILNNTPIGGLDHE